MSANGISTLATKQLKQEGKLAIAELKRQGYTLNADGSIDSGPDITEPFYRTLNVLDINLLPTKYVDDDIYDNPNLAEFTLTPGVIQTGIRKVTYTGYHEDNVAFTDTATATASTTANNFTIASIAETTTVLYTGYLLGTYTGNWTFTLTGDDSSYLWIGANAVSGYTTVNRTAFANYNTVGTVTVAITAGEYYPIRLLYGNGPASGYLNLTYAHTGQAATNNFTGKLFSPGIQLQQGRPWVYPPFPTFEQIVSPGATITIEETYAFKINIRSTSYDTEPFVNGQISINDALVVDTNGRGHTVLALTSSGTVIEQTRFDTWDGPGIDNMNTALLGYPAGTVIAICTYDATSLNAAVRATLNTYYGGTLADTWGSVIPRYSHIFIGTKI